MARHRGVRIAPRLRGIALLRIQPLGYSGHATTCKAWKLESRFFEGLLQQTRPDVATDHYVGDLPMPELVRHHEQDTLLLDQHSANRLLNSTYPQSPNDGGIDDADDLASDVAVLALSAAGREAQYFGPSSALSFARVAGATFGLHRRHDGSTVDAHNDTRSADQHRSLEPLQLPSFAVCQRLSRAYFENIHPQYPFLHKPTFGVWEEQCLHAQQRGTLEAAPKVALLFVLMVSRTCSWQCAC